jgi:hypothetical protein
MGISWYDKKNEVGSTESLFDACCKTVDLGGPLVGNAE